MRFLTPHSQYLCYKLMTNGHLNGNALHANHHKLYSILLSKIPHIHVCIKLIHLRLYNSWKVKYLFLSLMRLEWPSPVSVNAVWSLWKKSSPWLRDVSFCFSVALPVSFNTLADFKIAVRVTISVLFRQPCPLQRPSMMDTK